MTLSENESLGLKLVTESTKNDKEMENEDSNHVLGERKGEKKRFVIVLKKMGPLCDGSPAKNNYRVHIKDSNSATDQTNHDSSKEVNLSSSVTQALEKSPTKTSKFNGPLSPKFEGPLSPPIASFYPIVMLNDKPQFSTSVDEFLQIDQTATAEETTQTSTSDEATSPKLSAIQTEESLSVQSSTTLSASSTVENELETSSVSNNTDKQKQHLKDHRDLETQVELTKPMTTLLKFTLDFDHFPSSPSMIKLATKMNLPLSHIKEWFSQKRQEKRKNGFHLHNKVHIHCPYCQNQLPFANKELGQQHLYEEDHINQVLQIEQQNSEKESGKEKMKTTLDNVIMKALGFSSVGGLPSTLQENTGIAGSLNDNRTRIYLPQVKKKRSTAVRKEMPTPEECTLLLKPLEKGYAREVVYRATVGENHAHKKWDVYYRPPTGKKLRSKPNVEKHLEQMGIQDLTVDNFDFTYKCLGENVKNEIIRYATASQRPSANLKKTHCSEGNTVIPSVQHETPLPNPEGGHTSKNHQSKKPKVHHHPALKLNSSITYQKDTDLNAIPIMSDGKAVCEKCGAIGVKHAFYGKGRKYCSFVCASETLSLPHMSGTLASHQEEPEEMKRLNSGKNEKGNLISTTSNSMKRIDAAIVARILGSANSAQILGDNKNSYIVVKHLRGTMPCTDNGTKNTGDMTGFKSWHTPSLDKQDDKEQNLTSEINQAKLVSPVIEEEPNDNSNTSSVALHSKQANISDITQNVKQELNDHDSISSSVSDTHNQISLKNTAEDRPKIRIKSMLDLQDSSDKASTAEKPFAMKKLSSIFQFDKKNMPTSFGIQQEIINDSATGSTNFTDIFESESNSDSCNVNQAEAQIIPDNIPKNIESKGKRKRSDDELSANKKGKMEEEISFNENSDIAEITAIHTDSDLIGNGKILSNNKNDIKNNKDIVELSNDNIITNDIIDLSDTEHQDDDDSLALSLANEETDPLQL